MKFRTYDLCDFTKGWFVGDFMPTVARTRAVEVAVKRYSPGDREPLHHHKLATEITVVVSGQVEMCGEVYGPDTLIEIKPGQSTDFKALTDVTTVVVKMPGVRDDKYLD